jgi:hypothetical protein
LMFSAIASTRTIRRIFAEYALLWAEPPLFAQPGSFRYGSSHMIRDCIEIRTWRRVDEPAIQPGPCHVPSSDRQTFCPGQRLAFL